MVPVWVQQHGFTGIDARWQVIRFAHLVCVESSMTKMRKGAAKSASQACFFSPPFH